MTGTQLKTVTREQREDVQTENQRGQKYQLKESPGKSQKRQTYPPHKPIVNYKQQQQNIYKPKREKKT